MRTETQKYVLLVDRPVYGYNEDEGSCKQQRAYFLLGDWHKAYD